MKNISVRWCIATLLFFAAVLNYIDRQTLALLAPTIQADLGLTDQDYANINNAFLLAYTLAYLLSGRITDRLGVRLSLSIYIIWWSISNMLTGFARSEWSLGAFRSLLGLGEAGNWTAAPKAVSDFFPARERAMAIGFYTAGASLGATIAPGVIFIAQAWGWRSAFVLTGALGLLWLIPWLWLYRLPRENRLMGEKELKLILAAAEEEKATRGKDDAVAWSWGKLLSRKEVWLLLFARLLTDPVWYFFQIWFAKYLFSQRHVPQEGLHISSWVYLAAGIGSFGGGWFSGVLIKRGKLPAQSRMLTMLGCACLLPLSPLIAFAPSTGLAIAFSFVVVLAALSWLSNLSSLVVDVIPSASLGTVFGVVAAGSSIGAMIMNKTVANILSSGSYTEWFVVMAFLHPLAWLLLRFGGLGGGKKQPLPSPSSATGAS